MYTVISSRQGEGAVVLPEGGGVEGGHGPDQVLGVLGPGCLEAGVHGQLGQADVHGVQGDVGVGDVPQGGAAGTPAFWHRAVNTAWAAPSVA